MEVLKIEQVDEYTMMVSISGDSPGIVMSNDAKELASQAAVDANGWDPSHIAVSTSTSFRDEETGKYIRVYKIEP